MKRRRVEGACGRDSMRWIAAASLAALLAGPAAATDTSDFADLSRMSLEELGDVRVTSVSKRAEPMALAPASIYVIGSDEIRRSGAIALPEALRLAPNLEVGRGDGSQYAISSRGFQSTFVSNKLLVLIDGRSIYSSLHSGVFWDERNVMLDDVARIEVISGPGGTLWG
ncbi:MAG: hypothetical protein JWM77_3773, partial [Rhodospirillales bacterium]|nr:hypothetical protein [Rhodospirillales bacterium]